MVVAENSVRAVGVDEKDITGQPVWKVGYADFGSRTG